MFALLSLDLQGAKEEERNIFYKLLQKRGWTKIDNITTTWKKQFNNYPDNSEIENSIISDIEEARTLSFTKCEAIFMISKEEPINYSTKD